MNKTPTRVMDSEGNTFGVEDVTDTSATLRGQGGSKEICIHDLKFYKDITHERA